ncbi:hypothetical protein PG985_000326 [Apiospora marii]|uniref:uncharacterized protein n=1 Tax=Apiospora marii TaxID=335849 RepID=UPI00313266F2
MAGSRVTSAKGRAVMILDPANGQASGIPLEGFESTALPGMAAESRVLQGPQVAGPCAHDKMPKARQLPMGGT